MKHLKLQVTALAGCLIVATGAQLPGRPTRRRADKLTQPL